MEEKQWEIVGLGDFLDEIKDGIKEIPEYNPRSNEKYMRVSRNNNFLISSLLDFLVLFIPAILIIEYLFHKIFYCLFDYEISKFLRPYSFKLILVDLIIQGNVEYFTFLGFRSFNVLFTFNTNTTIMQVFSIFFMLVVLLVTICSYLGYYYQYGKYARYFLSNMYRFPSSYVLMTFVFGFRPFLKGLVHAFFFEQWSLQIWLLTGIELLMVIIIIFFEIVLDNHKHRLILFF